VGADAEAFSCFKWGAMPHEGADHIDGVEVSLNIDILWLVIAQGLFAHEWQGPGSNGACSKHKHTRAHTHAHTHTHTHTLSYTHTMCQMCVQKIVEV